ncbi:MAG TPA: hypothetical protein VES65_08810 [Solirubrobacteraceae bacterium]|nr:hypothetical protein [Solirubrobacteraceae bacterium]
MSIGIVSASQGSYSAEQLLLDITQGARVASSAYSQGQPSPMSLRTVGTGGVLEGWQGARRRAEEAPQLLQPGLLAAQIPGGAAYAGIAVADHTDAIAAADRRGRVAAVSLGTAATLLARIERLRLQRRFVVADLPGGGAGYEDLRALSEARASGELLLVLQRARAARGHALLWAGAAGLRGGATAGRSQRAGGSAGGGGVVGGGGRELSSQTTNERGLIAAMDLAPTILRHLGLTPVPADMRGQAIETGGPLDGPSLRALMSRLRVVGGRRLTALGWLLSAWALLLLISAVWPAGRSPDARAGSSPAGTPGAACGPASARARAWALRTGALAVLWAPVAVLIPAALEPSAPIEYATIALACMALGALTDLALPWPRAPILPAAVAVLALSVDALAGTQLLVRSVLGPNPALGARFYGIGNELKSGLAVLVLGAVAAALYPATHTRRAALGMACAGIVLAAVEGSARIGAGVGGVILVSAGAAVASVMLLPGALATERRSSDLRSAGRSAGKRALIVLSATVLALLALAALDLLTAHGAGHYTGSILHARSPADVRDVLVRRYKAAWDELRNHAMPVATLLALLCAVLGIRRRRRLLAPVAGDPGWEAALAGGLTAGVVGALAEDSGPVLLVVAVFALICLLAYLWGRPDARPPDATRLRLGSARSAARHRWPPVRRGPPDPGVVRPGA